ncbi:hypothetical protein L3073_07535 [Ancylomarina sp. DW003]|nr:DUF6804 family protein [Ancylomarina sp. DW003]MDE5422058.1 hypothetical protein [Ancylomarina sp. DW003]
MTTQKKEFGSVKYIMLLNSLLLIISIFDMSYGFYCFLRINIFFSLCLYLTLLKAEIRNKIWVFTSLIFITIYNPIFPLRLPKEIWIIINMIALSVFIVNSFQYKEKIFSTIKGISLTIVLLILFEKIIFGVLYYLLGGINKIFLPKDFSFNVYVLKEFYEYYPIGTEIYHLSGSIIVSILVVGIISYFLLFIAYYKDNDTLKKESDNTCHNKS